MHTCSSRKGTEETAAHLLAHAGGRGYVRDAAQRALLNAAADRAASKALAAALRGGVAFHHGNLEPGDRAAVEKLFLDRALLVHHLPVTLAVTAPYQSACTLLHGVLHVCSPIHACTCETMGGGC